MGSIDPHDVLPNGTKVRVKNYIGVVVDHKVVQAIPSGTIVVHTIEYNKIFHKKIFSESLGRRVELFKAIPRYTKQVNYSFITVLE